jgi:hypothetical protein
MPLEGHWQRVNTPLRRLTKRERNVVIAGVAATLAVIAALFIATAGDTEPPPAPGCISTQVPGVMGTEPFKACGDEAERACARHAQMTDPGSRFIDEACHDAGIGAAAIAAPPRG